MSEALIEKIEHIETLLAEINGKIDNFMGFEDLSDDETEEVKSGEYLTFDEVFGN